MKMVNCDQNIVAASHLDIVIYCGLYNDSAGIYQLIIIAGVNKQIGFLALLQKFYFTVKYIHLNVNLEQQISRGT